MSVENSVALMTESPHCATHARKAPHPSVEAVAAADAWLIEGARTRDRIGNATSDNMRFGFIEGFKEARLRGEAQIEAMQRSIDLLHRNGESLADSQLRMLDQLDAAQGEQQAVACMRSAEHNDDFDGACSAGSCQWPNCKPGHPQPVAVAGDAMSKRIRGLIAEIDPKRKPATGEMRHVANQLRSIIALSAAPAAPEVDPRMASMMEHGMASWCATPTPAAPAPVAGDAVAALSGKYGNVLAPFVRLMERELHANAGKGDRPGWLAMSADTALLEIYYHTAKLQKAVHTEAGDAISELAADVANLAMMLLDGCGGIDLAALAQDRASQVGAPDLTDELDFEPDEDHTVADMANVGYSLMQAIKSNFPEYCWGESPAEIVAYLINQRDEAMSASQAGAAGGVA